MKPPIILIAEVVPFFRFSASITGIEAGKRCYMRSCSRLMSYCATIFEDAVANAVVKIFDALPAKSKPAVQVGKVRHWVPLSGIVVSRGSDLELECVALGYFYGTQTPHDRTLTERNRTGLKCLPKAKVPGTRGCVLHDWHAEVLALRAFNHFLLQECLSLLEGQGECSTILQRTVARQRGGFPQPFSVREDVKIHMYCSEAPCGDCSMEFVMNAQEDANPWSVPSCERADAAAMELKGRESFSELGIVRRKPGQSSLASEPSRLC